MRAVDKTETTQPSAIGGVNIPTAPLDLVYEWLDFSECLKEA